MTCSVNVGRKTDKVREEGKRDRGRRGRESAGRKEGWKEGRRKETDGSGFRSQLSHEISGWP